VIVGGESGPGARPMNREWVMSIQKQCQLARVPFFFKQWGGIQKSKNGRELNGTTFDEFPLAIRATLCPSSCDRTVLVDEFSRETEMLACLS
jgi:protein gp37